MFPGLQISGVLSLGGHCSAHPSRLALVFTVTVRHAGKGQQLFGSLPLGPSFLKDLFILIDKT